MTSKWEDTKEGQKISSYSYKTWTRLSMRTSRPWSKINCIDSCSNQ